MGDVIKPHMLCKACGVHKIARLELIWCKECAEKENNEKCLTPTLQ